MLVINNKYKYDGTIKEMYNDYSIDSSCLCWLEIKQYSDCEAEIYDFSSFQDLSLISE